MPPTGSGGSGGGLSTVTTDSSLTGAGTVASPLGLLLVSTQPRLTGAGISSSKLDIAGWPVAGWQSTFGNDVSLAVGTANQVTITGFVLPCAVTFSHIAVGIQVVDASNLYDVGIYSEAGSLLAHIGAQAITATGVQAYAVSGGALTLAPALYAFAVTGNANTAQFKADEREGGWIYNANVAASSGGALPASIGALTPAPSVYQFNFYLY